MGEADEEGWITVTSSSKLQVHHSGLKNVCLKCNYFNWRTLSQIFPVYQSVNNS